MDFDLGETFDSLAEAPSDAEAEDFSESLLTTGAALAAAVGARHVCKTLWRRWRGGDPPTNPALRGVTWKDALLWGVVVGGLVGVSKVASRRGSTALQQRWRRR